MSGLLNWRRLARGVACGAAAIAMSAVTAFAQSGEPIKIGFSMSLTGPLADARHDRHGHRRHR